MKPREVMSVWEVSRRVAACLEKEFPEVWVQGEVTDFVRHSSGHWYFTLKDERAQLKAVMFKFQNRLLRFRPEEGMEFICRGRVRTYPPRSIYQLEVEWMEPAGRGALYLQLEQLKARLEKEGLFDRRRKRPIPSPLKRAAIITSVSGAAIHDMLRILRERDPGIEVLIIPAAVQGEGAAADLARAVALANRPEVARPTDRRPLEVIIIGRGGGSLEDLWAFNEEVLARAIAASSIPVISAVGHETDYTIADLVADLRAPTPTAAAEIIAAGRAERLQRTFQNHQRLKNAMQSRLALADSRLENLRERLQDPGRAIFNYMEKTDELSERATRALFAKLDRAGERTEALARALRAVDPAKSCRFFALELEKLSQRLGAGSRERLLREDHRLRNAADKIEVLSPRATLARGFAVARDRQGRVIKEAGRMAPGDDLELILHKGRLECLVHEVQSDVPPPARDRQ